MDHEGGEGETMTETNIRLGLAALRFVGELRGHSKVDLAMIAATLASKNHEEPRKAVEADLREASWVVFELTPEEWGELSEELLK